MSDHASGSGAASAFADEPSAHVITQVNPFNAHVQAAWELMLRKDLQRREEDMIQEVNSIRKRSL